MAEGDAGALRFRPGRAEDQAAIAEMVREVWEGEDYLPKVWREWAVAPRSLLRVGELDGQIVASGRLVEQVPGGWWAEGMRVHPRFQGRGLATQLHDFLIELALQQPGARSVGLATSSENPKIAHLALKSGMVERGRYRFLKATAQADAQSGVEASNAEPAQLMARLRASRWLEQSGGYAMDGWVTRPLDEAWLRELVAAGGAWRCGDAVALTGGGEHRDQTWLYLVDGGDERAQGALVRHARYLAFQRAPQGFLRCFVPADEALLPPLRAAGLRDPDKAEPFFIRHFVREK